MYYYFFVIADNIKIFTKYGSGWLIGFLCVYMVAYFLALIVKTDCGKDTTYSDFFFKSKRPVTIKLFTSLLILSVILFSMSYLIPSTKQLAVIYLIPTIAHNEEVKKIPTNIVKFVNHYLEEMAYKGTTIVTKNLTKLEDFRNKESKDKSVQTNGKEY